jgi:hypothetical protein
VGMCIWDQRMFGDSHFLAFSGRPVVYPRRRASAERITLVTTQAANADAQRYTSPR